MLYHLAALGVVGLHLAFVLFVALGALLGLRWRWIPWAHLPAAAWGAWVEWAGWICPLTPLENHLRTLAGLGGYRGGFIEHYLLRALYPDGLTRAVQVGLAAAVVLVNGAAYAWLWRRRRG